MVIGCGKTRDGGRGAPATASASAPLTSIEEGAAVVTTGEAASVQAHAVSSEATSEAASATAVEAASATAEAAETAPEAAAPEVASEAALPSSGRGGTARRSLLTSSAENSVEAGGEGGGEGGVRLGAAALALAARVGVAAGCHRVSAVCSASKSAVASGGSESNHLCKPVRVKPSSR